MHPALCGWVLVDALRDKDLLLLRFCGLPALWESMP